MYDKLSERISTHNLPIVLTPLSSKFSQTEVDNEVERLRGLAIDQELRIAMETASREIRAEGSTMLTMDDLEESLSDLGITLTDKEAIEMRTELAEAMTFSHNARKIVLANEAFRQIIALAPAKDFGQGVLNKITKGIDRNNFVSIGSGIVSYLVEVAQEGERQAALEDQTPDTLGKVQKSLGAVLTLLKDAAFTQTVPIRLVNTVISLQKAHAALMARINELEEKELLTNAVKQVSDLGLLEPGEKDAPVTKALIDTWLSRIATRTEGMKKK